MEIQSAQPFNRPLSARKRIQCLPRAALSGLDVASGRP